jgi:N-acetylglucosaminyl-diphospho-decaprenol L-rhamnosyltransferase
VSEDVTVLIANLGRLENLRPCLASVVGPARGNVSLRVILGFNFEGESDSSRAVAREFPEVEQLRAPVKMGYCRAYNQLMARGTGRYFLLLDDDTVLAPHSIEGMVRFMDEHPDVGIAGCRTTNRDGSYQKSTAKMFTLGTEFVNVFQPRAFWKDGIDATVRSWRPAAWLNGHFLIVRAAVFEQVGGFDEFYYTVQSEPDWCLRIWQAGWQVAYVPEVEVMHIGGEHSVATTVKSRANIIRVHVNRYYFIRKHYGAASMHLLRVIMSAAAVLRLLKYIVLWLVSVRHRPEAGPKIAAYWQVVLLGRASHPDRLPDDLARAYANFASFGPSA